MRLNASEEPAVRKSAEPLLTIPLPSMCAVVGSVSVSRRPDSACAGAMDISIAPPRRAPATMWRWRRVMSNLFFFSDFRAHGVRSRLNSRHRVMARYITNRYLCKTRIAGSGQVCGQRLADDGRLSARLAHLGFATVQAQREHDAAVRDDHADRAGRHVHILDR